MKPQKARFSPWQNTHIETGESETGETSGGNSTIVSQAGSFSRLWRGFMTARVTIAALLLALQTALFAWSQPTHPAAMGLCTFYLAATLAVRFFARPSPTFDKQWGITIGIDVLVFSVLNFLQAGGINPTPLFALPVLLAAVLGSSLLALGTAACVTLLLLTDAWRLALTSSGDFAAHVSQAGLNGIGFFAVALLAGQLAQRLAREEQLARQSQSAAQLQAQVNQLVIDALSDGVMVVDFKGRVQSANPAARRLLFLNDQPAAGNTRAQSSLLSLSDDPAWQPLAHLAEMTLSRRLPQESEVRIVSSRRDTRRLQARTRLAAHGNNPEHLCVMFLEDQRQMEARIRTEKMAAMGRMSAAVAHEIRNPLSAISQANSLLEEELEDADQLRLTKMVSQNVLRLNRIVEDVLNISRARTQETDLQACQLPLGDQVRQICQDWSYQHGHPHLLELVVACQHRAVQFEPEHLRRLLVNLLDNARRYASGKLGSIRVSTDWLTTSPPRLLVWSDGPPLEKGVETHLFEPFFSSESRSSGLGLFLCRELCERYGAYIGYQRVARTNITTDKTSLEAPQVARSMEGNEFFVIFKAAEENTLPASGLTWSAGQAAWSRRKMAAS